MLKVPLWKDLIVGYNNAVSHPINLDEEFNANKECPEITELIFNNSDDNKKIYNSYLAEAVKPKADFFTALGAYLEKRFKQIITTNFDTVFDRIIEFNNTNDRKELIYPVIKASNFTGKVITYLHGKVSSDYVIFREEEYLNAYRNSKIKIIENFLRDIITSKSLLFIGFSFNDEDFKSLLTRLIDEVNYEKRTLEATYGRTIDGLKLNNIYVIYSSDEVTEEKFKNNKIDIKTYETEFSQLFEVKRINGKNIYKLKESVTRSYSNNLLKDENYKDLKNFVDSLFTIRKNLKFFERYGFNVLPFNETTTITEYIDDISKDIGSVSDINQAQTID